MYTCFNSNYIQELAAGSQTLINVIGVRFLSLFSTNRTSSKTRTKRYIFRVFSPLMQNVLELLIIVTAVVYVLIFSSFDFSFSLGYYITFGHMTFDF